ncbi:hypothetical protein TSUD_284460 [Trifolium subterraneum]|uniref:Uncharacterized protein n=1 Tax=Trifolium subterraneum TaxID=3900 RepID=A0A2Z6PFP3_TRISU|nr:hypothetical protein TSUD_284460 [Trifolium subterraneum]
MVAFWCPAPRAKHQILLEFSAFCVLSAALYSMEAGVIFSSGQRKQGGASQGTSQGKDMALKCKKRKEGGMFRHSSLKKVVRLPCKDRREVLKILNKIVQHRRGKTSANRSGAEKNVGSSQATSSSESVNNDWKNWVVMHSDDQMAADDVGDIGKAIGFKFNSNNSNMFSDLTRSRKGKHVSQVAGGGGGTEKGWASGGLLTKWDSSKVEIWSSTSQEHVLWCHGCFLKSEFNSWMGQGFACVGISTLSGAKRSDDHHRQCLAPQITSLSTGGSVEGFIRSLPSGFDGR